MVKHSNQVHTTTDYFLFKPIEGNRNKNLLHINRLKKSKSDNYLFTVIIVNEKYEIIDGQHRFEVIQELKLPLHYIVCKGYGLNEVHILNQNSKTWNADDYLTGYCNLGYEDYLKYALFKEKYNLGHNETMSLLSGIPNKIDIDVANIFFQIPALSLTISAIAVMIFSAYILYDISRIVTGGEDNYISATLAVYLDIYNVFVSLLNLLMIFSGDRD